MTAAIPLFLVAGLMWRRKLPRLAACLALTAGAALTSGWLHTAITTGAGWATGTVNWVTRSTVGGVVPGAVALVLFVYFLLELAPSTRTMAGLHPGSARDGYSHGDRHRRRGLGRFGQHSKVPVRMPDLPPKTGAVLVALVLPLVVDTIPGDVGAVIRSPLNLLGGLLAWLLGLAWGVA